MAGKPNRVAAPVRDSPTQQQLDLYYIREAVQGICHDFEESAKNHNDSTQRTAAHSVTAGGCGQTSPRRSTAPPGRRPHLDSDHDPDLVLPDLRRKPVHPLLPHRRAPAVAQAEPPAVQGADNFSLLDPALAQRATGVRAAIRQGHNRLTGPEDRQAQTKNLAGSTPPRGDLIDAARQHPIGHDTWHSRRQQRRETGTSLSSDSLAPK